jgi:hypothetical protein
MRGSSARMTNKKNVITVLGLDPRINPVICLPLADARIKCAHDTIMVIVMPAKAENREGFPSCSNSSSGSR